MEDAADAVGLGQEGAVHQAEPHAHSEPTEDQERDN